MSVGAIGAEILGGGGIHPPPWYTSLKHPMVLGVKGATNIQNSGVVRMIWVNFGRRYIYASFPLFLDSSSCENFQKKNCLSPL